MDIFTDIVDTLRVRGVLYFRTRFTSPWSVQVPAYRKVARFHLITGGRSWVRISGELTPTLIQEGDLILIPQGNGHILSDSPDRPPLDVDDVVRQTGFTGSGTLVYSAADIDGEARGEFATMVCGHLEFDDGFTHPLLADLPAHILVRSSESLNHTWLANVLRFITHETQSEFSGADAVVKRLSEILFIQVARAYLDTAGEDLRFIAALKDPQLSRALSALHAEPGCDWTVESLAQTAGLSRARFAARFQQMVGRAPIAYLTQWRMLKAAQMLRQTEKPIKTIARGMGYRTEQTFSRAFSQHFMQPPQNYRSSYLVSSP